MSLSIDLNDERGYLLLANLIPVMSPENDSDAFNRDTGMKILLALQLQGNQAITDMSIGIDCLK